MGPDPPAAWDCFFVRWRWNRHGFPALTCGATFSEHSVPHPEFDAHRAYVE
jgi:hypothetical protein